MDCATDIDVELNYYLLLLLFFFFFLKSGGGGQGKETHFIPDSQGVIANALSLLRALQHCCTVMRFPSIKNYYIHASTECFLIGIGVGARH